MNPKKGQKKCPICGRFSDYQWQAGGWYCPAHKFFFPSDLRNPRKRRNPNETKPMAKSLLPALIIGTAIVVAISYAGRRATEE